MPGKKLARYADQTIMQGSAYGSQDNRIRESFTITKVRYDSNPAWSFELKVATSSSQSSGVWMGCAFPFQKIKVHQALPVQLILYKSE
jgi:hypothetical protein